MRFQFALSYKNKLKYRKSGTGITAKYHCQRPCSTFFLDGKWKEEIAGKATLVSFLSKKENNHTVCFLFVCLFYSS